MRDLFSLGTRIESADFDATSFIPLFEHIDRHASDEEICTALFALLASYTTDPPTVFSKVPLDTPLKSTSSSQHADEQTHDDIDERILQEINGCVYRDTGGFYGKYFEEKEWSADAYRITQMANPQVRSGRWTEYPTVPSQDAFFDWFWGFQSGFLCRGRSMFYASPDHPLAGSDCKRKPDLFLAPTNVSKHGGKYNWADVRVIGELKQSEIRGKYTEELLKFTGHAREVFAAQPTRRFLHGFVIRGSIMELWVFDRSGLYGSKKFDIHKDPRRFIQIMFGYTRMSDEELGMNTYIKEDKEGKYIVLEEETKKDRVYLEDTPIAFQRAIVCRGTACYRAKKRGSQRWQYVVKFAWRSDKRQAEGELLKLAKERNVWGVAKLTDHHDLDAIAELRSGLKFGKPQTFRSARRDSINQSRSRTQSSLLANALGISLTPRNSSSSAQKRKRAEEKPMAPPPKRSRSGSCRRSRSTGLVTAQTDIAVGGASNYVDKNSDVNSLTAPDVQDDGLFENRIFSCLITSPPGRPLREFTSVHEFLEACRDFVKAHRSLYCDGKILHRDISENNIIITDAEWKEDPTGMIIDLDLGKELDGGPSGARHRTGTMEFMAIEILEGKPHTYRHDLESFFYVFVWIISQARDKALLKTSRLRRWYAGSYDQTAEIKRGHMDKKAFQGILAEFPQAFHGLKGLAEELRRLLFPIREEALFTGTYHDPERLYQPMIDAFERAIVGYEGSRNEDY